MTGAIIIEGHVQGLANLRALGSRGIPVFVVDKNDCLARYSRYCLQYFKCPDYSGDDFADFLITLAGQQDINNWCLIPSNDHAVMTISRNKARLSKHFAIITPGSEIIEKILNKQNLLTIASSMSIPIPASYFDPREIENGKYPGISFPLITRGKYGLSFYRKTKEKAYISKNIIEFKKQMQEIRLKGALEYAFTQEVIPLTKDNRTVSFVSFSVNGEMKTFWMGVKLRDHPFNFGTATFTKSIYIEGLIEPSRKIIRELSYTGVCEIEYLRDPRDNEYKLIEINARTWLWVGHARETGIDFTLMIYNHLNNIEQEFPSDYLLDHKWINWLTDVPNSLMAIVKGKLPLREYLSSLKGEKVKAIFHKKDPKPVFAFFWLLLTVFRKR